MSDLDPQSYLCEVIEALEKATEHAVALSESRLGVVHTGRQNRVLMAYSKTIVHAMSIQLLHRNSMNQKPEFDLLDHFSIAALTRTLADASIMTLYLSEPSLSEAEWDLRRHVLFLHDASNRKRFLKAMHKHAGEVLFAEELDAHRQDKIDILKIITQRSKELGLDENWIDELSKGQLVFMDGVRGAVREAGLDTNEFDFMHVYLSSHVHSHPVSLLRQEKISFEAPTDFQMIFCGLCLEAATIYLENVNSRVKEFTGDMVRDPNGHID
ncbi:DUF5677 domain-containing protein [Rhodovulum sulfidophilum]|uniref:DUF5677 domain-containing protein n=1 Tax=Rhodovulum sulfidophilum TaxID=35806 RepID=UPI00192181AA|nr:DUF5677 domain-containing protein [Rhodovulum sulfidophilum]MBL3562988.1 hypothetical protein [Rhodovulum sulfidophilum]